MNPVKRTAKGAGSDPAGGGRHLAWLSNGHGNKICSTGAAVVTRERGKMWLGPAHGPAPSRSLLKKGSAFAILKYLSF